MTPADGAAGRTPRTVEDEFADALGDLMVEPDPIYWSGYRDGKAAAQVQADEAVEAGSRTFEEGYAEGWNAREEIGSEGLK